MNGRERVFALLEDRPVDRVPLMPITMLFAADQTGAPYGRYALDYRVLVEAQLRTAELFDFDHVSAITETREAPDCGAEVRYFDDQPYALDESHALLADKSAFRNLAAPDPVTAPHMSDRLEALAALKRAAGNEKIVEGWVEGPCGGSADLRGINTLMTDFHDDPGFVTDLFEFVVDLATRFGRAQVEAGADVIGIGDPAASLVGPKLYDSFVLPYEKKLRTASTPPARASACTSAATRAEAWNRSPPWERTLWTSTPWFRSPTPARKWDPGKSCWATWTPSGCCCATHPKPYPPR